MNIFKKYGSSIVDIKSFIRCIEREGRVSTSDIDEAIENKVIEQYDIDTLLKYIKTNNIKYLDKLPSKSKKSDLSYESKGAVGLYLKEVGSLKRLTEDEEMLLWEQLKEYNLAKSKINKDDLKSCLKIDNNIDFLRNKLVKSNLRLVVNMAKRYYSSGVPFIDIIEEGNIGLIEAISRFDYTKGFKFSTYAAWWIKQSIIKAVASKRDVIRYPMHIARLIKKYIVISKKLSETLNRAPLQDEIASEMGISVKVLQSISVFSNNTVSLESSINVDGQSVSITDFIEDKQNPPPQKDIFMDSLKTTISEALGELTEKEREIIILRYGLNGEKPLKLESVGKKLNITRERVRQIQEKALKKIRKLNLSEELKGFLWD